MNAEDQKRWEHWFEQSFRNHMREHVAAHNRLVKSINSANEKAANAVKKLMAENVELRKEIGVINRKELRINEVADIVAMVLTNAA